MILAPQDIEEIRKRREAIDGAPWEYDAEHGQRVIGKSPGGCSLQVSDYTVADIRGWGHLQYRGKERGDKSAQAIQDANGAFIGNAPQDVSNLLSTCDALSSQLASHTGSVSAGSAAIADGEGQASCAMREALVKARALILKLNGCYPLPVSPHYATMEAIDAALSPDAPRQKVEG